MPAGKLDHDVDRRTHCCYAGRRAGAGGTYLLLPHRHGAPAAQRACGRRRPGEPGAAGLPHVLEPARSVSGHALLLHLQPSAAIVGRPPDRHQPQPDLQRPLVRLGRAVDAGLFLLAGAQFLAAGTVIVYAGAIIVTFLFVIMLAQMEGKAVYDRAARAPARATLTCFLLFWCLIYALGPLTRQPVTRGRARRPPSRPPTRACPGQLTSPNPTSSSEDHPPSLTGACPADLVACTTPTGTEKPNVAGLGESLYTDHLVTVGLAGVLLFVALSGPSRSPIPSGRSGPASGERRDPET